MFSHRVGGLAFLCAASLLAGATGANASVVSGGSSSYAESVALTVTPLIGVSGTIGSGPLPVASGSAPSPYNDAHSVLSVTIADILSTGVLNAGASSNIDGTAGAKFASASSSVDQLGLSILGALGIGASAVSSAADISGDYGALLANGSTTLAGLSLNGLGILTVAPTVNDVLLDAAGIRIVLNEQSQTGDGIGSAALDVNAIHISLTDVPYLWGLLPSVLNGDIVIGHSEAFMTAAADQLPGNPVPEPATLALAGTGLIALFGMRRKRAPA